MQKKCHRRRKDSGIATILEDLPTEVLLLIITDLDHEDRISLSLVSKSFRSLTNGLFRKLTFCCIPSDSALQKIFTRFSSVSTIAIRSASSIPAARALTAVANSGLNIECLELHRHPSFLVMEQIRSLSGKLATVKALRLEWSGKMAKLQVVEFGHLFPFLHVLELSSSDALILGLKVGPKDVPYLGNFTLRDHFDVD